MQDELLLRQWTAGHSQFSADLDRLVGKLRAWSTFRAPTRSIIDPTYASRGRRADPLLSSAGNTLLSGLAAIVTTIVLFATVAFVATPNSDHDSSLDASAGRVVAYQLA